MTDMTDKQAAEVRRLLSRIKDTCDLIEREAINREPLWGGECRSPHEATWHWCRAIWDDLAAILEQVPKEQGHE